MLAVVQKVKRAKVASQRGIEGSIGRGFLIYLGIAKNDTVQTAEKLAVRISKARLFENGYKNFHLSIEDIDGDIMVISQFTLHADTNKGRRPSFSRAAPAKDAEIIYLKFIEKMKELSINTVNGDFQQYMEIDSVNTGHVTIIFSEEEI